MKKVLVVLLVFIMAFSVIGCGNQKAESEEPVAETTTYTSIPLGGNLKDLPLEGKCYGEYVKTEFKEDVDLSALKEASLYYCEGSETPYIAVYRWSKDGYTIEEETKYLANEYDAATYKMVHWDEMDVESGYFSLYYNNGEPFYVDCNILEDVDDYVEIDFYEACDEIALGDTGKSIYIPKGYNDLMDQDCKDHGTIFIADYDAEYDIPYIFLGNYIDSYEQEEWLWWDEFPEGLPFDEKTYNNWVADGWEEDENKAYYEALGFGNYIHYINEEKTDDYESVYIVTKDNKILEDMFFNVGDDWFNLSLTTDINVGYCKAIYNSIH